MSVPTASVITMTPATLEAVARMRLVAHGLIEPLPTPLDAPGHLTCAQGQDLPGALTSLALRTTGRSLDEVRAELLAAWQEAVRELLRRYMAAGSGAGGGLLLV
ncbi:hypothetical protein BJF82_07650 [Kytococcus sp. CUA-901]|nr:hypothetical protein BJF82_07650 [Kytococcus sp. CUA-901]